eukprot:TRINITY_DN3498_c0_g1_i6.p1 TRINITY_DN3498_c0_g1~~TRINITY_DN3498_c0_g1_i6.p1  ORF type:complete len:359 (+),score=65.80 TRINITY_DN3498_c0_g1_i6:110-1078(+)
MVATAASGQGMRSSLHGHGYFPFHPGPVPKATDSDGGSLFLFKVGSQHSVLSASSTASSEESCNLPAGFSQASDSCDSSDTPVYKRDLAPMKVQLPETSWAPQLATRLEVPGFRAPPGLPVPSVMRAAFTQTFTDVHSFSLDQTDGFAAVAPDAGIQHATQLASKLIQSRKHFLATMLVQQQATQASMDKTEAFASVAPDAGVRVPNASLQPCKRTQSDEHPLPKLLGCPQPQKTCKLPDPVQPKEVHACPCDMQQSVRSSHGCMAPSSRGQHAKKTFTCRYVFTGYDVDRFADFELVPRLIGRGGSNMRPIAKACGGKVRI